MRSFFFACALLVAGCGGSSPAVSDLGVPTVDLTPAGPDLASTLCMDPRADAWSLPIVKTTTNGLFKVTLSAGDPDPPATGINTWTLDVTDPNGAPQSNLAFTVKPWMPDHGHGTSVKASVTAGASAGSYTVTPLYLFMAGLWQVTFTVQPAGSSVSDQVMFSVCLADLMSM